MKALVKWNEIMMNNYAYYLLMLIKLHELKPQTTQNITQSPHYTYSWLSSHPHIQQQTECYDYY